MALVDVVIFILLFYLYVIFELYFTILKIFSMVLLLLFVGLCNHISLMVDKNNIVSCLGNGSFKTINLWLSIMTLKGGEAAFRG